MAAVNLVILSSSPSKPHYHAPLAMPSAQDEVQSPSTLWRNQPKLKMPTNSAKRMSTTPQKESVDAGEPKNNDIWDVPDDDPPTKVAEAKPAAKPRGRPRKMVAAIVEDGTTEAKPLKKRGRPKTVVAEGDETTAPKEKAVRKLRAKKVDEDGQTKIAKGRVTKASSSTVPKAKTTLNTTGTVSSYFAAAPADFIDIDDLPAKPAPVPQDLELKKAGERRMSWTPAKESNYPYQMEEFTPEATQDETTTEPKGFSSLLGSYGYAKTERSPSTTIMDDSNPLRKRKHIELVKTGNAATMKATETAKPKAVKKKARTITDKATAEYAAADNDEAEAAPILQYFRREDSLVDPSGAPRTKARKILTKPGKGKKATEPVSALLAPQAALEHAKRQEFVFGTSSQLARDDDPAFLRDLQQAMQLSNHYDVDDPFAEPLPSLSSTTGSGKAKLWEAAALIEEEGAKHMEALDLSRSSQVENHFNNQVTPAPTTDAEASRQSALSTVPEDDWIEIDQTPTPALVPQHVPAPPPRREHSPSPIVHGLEPRLAAMVLAPKATNNADLSTSNPDVPLMASRSQAAAKRITPAQPTAQCPDYDSYSTTELTKEIAKYKFKPIKKREDMVAMLKQCWEAKQNQTSGILQHKPKPIEAPPPSSQPPAPAIETVASPPRKRGRPRKGEPTTASIRKLDPKPLTTTKTKPPSASAPAPSTPKKRGRPRKVLPIPEDIFDAEGPPTPSPPRVRSTQPQALEIFEDSEDDADATLLPLSPSSLERELFSAISRAVTTQPPSRDIKRLSWYEKILLYDPILLENLTKWLNEEGLGRVGYDGEVMPLQVKQWCQRKSVCCLFKESKRNRGVGGVKKIGRE